MTDVCIIYHSQSGANTALAQAAFNGVLQVNGAKVRVVRACDINSKELLHTKAVILCFAEMNASIAGGMKELLDRVYYPLLAHQKILPCAVCMSVGNDGSGALRVFERIATGLSLKPVCEPIVIHGLADVVQLQSVEELAQGLTEGVLMGIY